MKPSDPQPRTFHQFEAMGGVLTFTLFEDAAEDEATALTAIGAVLGEAGLEDLRRLGCRSIDDGVFFGDCFDPKTGALLHPGTVTLKGNKVLTAPKLIDLDGQTVLNSSRSLPEPGTGGEFAHAFAHPPYGMRAPNREVQAVFDKIVAIIMPEYRSHIIRDWSSPHLAEFYEIFSMGMEWWGVFLFTVQVPDLRRLTVIVGSSTD